MRKIGLLVERERAWGRLLCEGVAAFAQQHGGWSLKMLEREDLRQSAYLKGFDGFIARVATPETAARFASVGRPVADLSCERQLEGVFARGVEQDNLAIGRLAARHFIEHRFVNFAYCGFDGKRFSDERKEAFVRTLAESGFPCLRYKTPASAIRDFDASVSRHERMTAGADAPRLGAWLKTLPKPCAVFCANDLRSYQLLQACEANGFPVPDEIAILGVDNDSLICNFTTPTLSSIDPDAFSLGHAAAESLEQTLADPSHAPARPRKIPPRDLVVRASSETYPLDPPWLSKALIHIHRDVSHHLTASEVCRSLKLSHTRVNAVFREKLGTTIQQEIRAAQLAAARRLLKTTALPLAEIANSAGFSTPQYFCNVYTSVFGHAPSMERLRDGAAGE